MALELSWGESTAHLPPTSTLTVLPPPTPYPSYPLRPPNPSPSNPLT